MLKEKVVLNAQLSELSSVGEHSKKPAKLFQIPEGDSLNNDLINTPIENISGKTSEIKVELNLKETLDAIKIDPTEELKPPKVAWEQIANYGDNLIMGTLGNISTVIGKAKSRKSFYLNMMAAILLQNDEYKGYKCCLPESKRHILYFDTEQSKHHVQLAVKRICKQIGDHNPANLTVYPLRTFNPAERLKLIEEAIKITPNVGFVFIDGVRDVVTSINCEEQATDVTSKLMKWSEENEIHITCVLHQNKNDSNARGHIGTELINKSETVLSVTVDITNKDVSIVEAEFCRNKSPETIAFEIIDSLPEVIEDYKPKGNKKKGKFDLHNLSDKQREEILDNVYIYGDEFSHGELSPKIKLSIKKLYSEDVGNNKISAFITYCKNNNLIFQEKNRAPYKRKMNNQPPF